jgi:PEGA domain-containing protein
MSQAAHSNSRDTAGVDDLYQPPAGNAVPIRGEDEADPWGLFLPEGADGRVDASGSSAGSSAWRSLRRSVARRKPVIAGMTALVAILVVAVGVRAWSAARSASQPASSATSQNADLGTVTLNSRPSGATVLVDSVARGTTPLQMELATGDHMAVFRSDAGERTIRLAVERGTRVVENVDMPAPPSALGHMEVTSDPTGARVALDGKAVGQTPITLQNLPTGRHAVAIGSGSNVVNRAVDVRAGVASTVFVALAASAPTSTGTFVVDAPVDLRLLESGELLGVSNAAPLPLRAGRHQFELVNEALELQLTRSVTINTGKLTRLSVPVPNGTLFANATPWAEVFVDGRSVGVTPLGNVAVAVGRHAVTWRHPQLGERRGSITVGARTPARITMDMTR